jgi:hypothetical protein
MNSSPFFQFNNFLIHESYLKNDNHYNIIYNAYNQSIYTLVMKKRWIDKHQELPNIDKEDIYNESPYFNGNRIIF